MIQPLANKYTVIAASPEPKSVFCYTPGILRLPNGALLATMDFGGADLREIFPGAPVFNRLPLMTYIQPTNLGRVYVSLDDGATWRHACDFPLCHARPFLSGGDVYIIGHHGNIGIIQFDIDDMTCGPVYDLTQNQIWHQSACNVWCDRGHVYLTMERLIYTDIAAWPVAAFAPVLMRAKEGSDLTKINNWTWASEIGFRDIFEENRPSFFGFPCYRDDVPMGWLETNVVRITDPAHAWYDHEHPTLHLLMRMHTGSTGYCGLLKVIENEDGNMITDFQTVPSGQKLLFLPMPGGQMKFHIVYDDFTNLYWLLSTQATYSMIRKDSLPKWQHGPNNQRSRLVLHFSRNCVDWCFAGVVAIGENERCSRHYASMIIDIDDLLIVSRSGDNRALSAHDGNMITFHRISNFRNLVY